MQSTLPLVAAALLGLSGSATDPRPASTSDLDPGARPARGDWVALRLPSLCQQRPAELAPLRLETGRHLVLPGDDLQLRSNGPVGVLPVAALTSLLQEHAHLGKLDVQIHPIAPPVLVRGEPAAIDSLQALVDELDGAGERLAVELSAWWTEGTSADSSHPDEAALEAATRGAGPWAGARVRSGASTMLGTRSSRDYLAGYSVEVATDAGIADPLMGSILTGRTLHLRATRVQSGRRVHLEGFFDLARLVSLHEYDTGSPDLGILQVPTLDTAQVAFSGVVPSGGLLAVSFAGLPERLSATGSATLWVRARTQAEPDPGESETTWRTYDLALFETSVDDLPLPLPGASLDDLLRPATPRPLIEALSASTVAQMAELARPGSRSGRAGVSWTPGLVIAPRGDGTAWREVDSLIAAAEHHRLGQAELTLTQGNLRVVLPVTEGMPYRVSVGRERSLLVDYDAHVAQETWMPAPEMAALFDGLLLQGHLQGARLVSLAWRSSSREATDLTRLQSNIGRLQLLDRDFESEPFSVTASGGAQEVLETAGARPALGVSLRSR